ncbi:class I SAM-dependent methyltransferase [Deinococcus multiflagellatus]|uniref:class I SAM-dependent methyltransferase n=1 Tax=Deinococcus multiflagellatus TaxID=1656887 RepID=UPI001CCE3411|nr:methyltransferase domain-containing protein [Deinococcus multiflagellatus]MBZ9712355.1 methyltransferase domain-containing protein [Deinococcus multiflagellatus]
MSGEREQANARLFDAVAATYDEVGFLAQAARFVAEVAAVQPHEAVLDVMTGTGTVLRALPHGGSGARVGTDLSAGMLAVARAELPGATFVQADAARLPFPDAQFDAVICAAGLFFMPDMAHTVREWARVLRPGGRLVVSSFGAGLLGDLPGLWRAALGAHGLKPGSPPLGRLPTPQALADVLRAGGLQASAALHPLFYTLPSPQARLADIQAGLEGAPLAGLPAAQRAQLLDEHRAALAPLFAAGPLSVPLPVIVGTGLHLPGDATRPGWIA